MSKLLDLRNKGIEKVKVVERVIFKPRSFKYEMIRMSIVIFTVASIGFGISNADDIPVLKNLVEENKSEITQKTFNIKGIVSQINESSLNITNAKNKEEDQGEDFIVELNKLPIKIKGEVRENTLIRNKFGNEFSVSDIEVGQTIIVKGLLEGDIIFAHTVVIFPEIEKVELEIATTTIDTASSTDVSTTTEFENASSTETSSTENTSTTTEEAASTTESKNTDQNIVEKVIETITNTVKNVVETITNIIKPEETPTEESTPDNTEVKEVVEPEPAAEPIPEQVPGPVS